MADVEIQAQQGLQYYFQVSMPAEHSLGVRSINLREIRRDAAAGVIGHDPVVAQQ
jgi:hypothetical protein